MEVDVGFFLASGYIYVICCLDDNRSICPELGACRRKMPSRRNVISFVHMATAGQDRGGKERKKG